MYNVNYLVRFNLVIEKIGRRIRIKKQNILFPIIIFWQLALHVLSFLGPLDLCRAAQTCQYWRVLAEDNLLWREKCLEESIDEQFVAESRTKGGRRASACKSPWKAAFMRQQQIEHNWREAKIRPPKVSGGVICILEWVEQV